MKGVLLCGGEGTRLMPLTAIANKSLLPIYNKPMVMYPLETLKALGIKDIMIITGGNKVGSFADFLGDGSKYGVNLTYRVQEKAGGIAQALGLAKDFAGKDSIAVILGDNIFNNKALNRKLPDGVGKDKAMLFFCEVKDPSRFGVPVFKGPASYDGKLIAIEEKPKVPKSNLAVTGLYIYPSNVFDIIPKLKPSKRGELEISDVNNWYVKKGKCDFQWFSGFWSDAGTFDSLLASANWIKDNSTLDK